jgi:hypothetical protein
MQFGAVSGKMRLLIYALLGSTRKVSCVLSFILVFILKT